MINYYEILEVSEKASNEIIEKAYKVLAKKYHPDLQQEGDKKVAEEKMKIINEAYDILSNNEKREAYNKKLNDQREKDRIKNQVQNNINNNYTKPDINNYKVSNNNINPNKYNHSSGDKEELKRQQKYRKKLEIEARRRYLEAYDNYLRSLGYKVKYRWTWDKVKSLFLTILIFLIIGVILWVVPPTRNYMIKLYEENFVIKIIVDITISIINSIIDIFKK